MLMIAIQASDLGRVLRKGILAGVFHMNWVCCGCGLYVLLWICVLCDGISIAGLVAASALEVQLPCLL